MSRPRVRTSILASIVLLGGALYLAAQGSSPAAAPERQRKRVRVVAAAPTSLQRSVTFPGVTRPRQRASLAFLLAGRLASRAAEIGDQVDAGALLATLDARQLRHQLAAAEAGLADAVVRRGQAERDERRAEELAAQRAATAEELERDRAAAASARAAEEAAAAGRDEARRRLAESELRAPFTGTVLAVHAEVGESVVPGAPVVTLAGRDAGVEVYLQVPENVARQLGTAPVEVRFPGDERAAARGEVRAMALGAAAAGALFPLLVQLDDHALPPGITAEVILTLAASEALEVPVAAVINPGGRRPAVYRLRDGAVRRIPVEILSLRGEQVALAGELAGGDEVVVGGHRGLIDGEAVEVLR